MSLGLLVRNRISCVWLCPVSRSPLMVIPALDSYPTNISLSKPKYILESKPYGCGTPVGMGQMFGVDVYPVPPLSHESSLNFAINNWFIQTGSYMFVAPHFREPPGCSGFKAPFLSWVHSWATSASKSYSHNQSPRH